MNADKPGQAPIRVRPYASAGAFPSGLHHDRSGAAHHRPAQELRLSRRRAGRRDHAAARRALRADRSERRRQDHADQPDHRRAAAGFGPDPARRGGDHRARTGSPCQAGPGAHVPDQRAVSRSGAARGGDTCGLRKARCRERLVATARRFPQTRWTRRTKSWPRSTSAAVCHRATRELAYGQQRLLEIALALATRPKVLLLDEPAAGVPRQEGGELFEAIANLSADITVLFIEHDMEVVFRFASRVIVMVGGRLLLEGTPRGDRRRSARARGLSGPDAPWLRRCSRLTMCAPATAIRSCSTASRWNWPRAAASRCSAATAWARRRCCSRSWGSRAWCPAAIRWRGRDIGRIAPHRRARLGIGWCAQEREIFPSLTVEENLTVAARAGRWDLPAVYRLFPRLAERRRNMGNHLSGGEQQMLAIARALTTNPGAAAARRTAGGPGADHRRGTGRRDRPHDRGGGHRDHAGRAAHRGGAVAGARGGGDRARHDRAARARRRRCWRIRRASTG